MHARLAGEILVAVGYELELVERVSALLRKRGLKTDPQTQTLEDVACLVFLEGYAEEFFAQHDDATNERILVKTWRKMSRRGRSAALEADLPPPVARLLEAALAGAEPATAS